jgi:hypothetical protein
MYYLEGIVSSNGLAVSLSLLSHPDLERSYLQRVHMYLTGSAMNMTNNHS